MKDSWYTWIFVLVLVVVIFVALNYKEKHENVPLDEIFQQEAATLLTSEQKTAVVTPQVPPVVIQTPSDSVPKKVTIPTPPKENISPQPPVQSVQTLSSLGNLPYTIQVASFKEKDKADKIVKDLQSKGITAFLASINLGEKGTWHRVYVGNFESKEKAGELLKAIQKDYPQSIVLKVGK